MPNRPTLTERLDAYRQPSRERLGLYASLYAMLLLTAVLGRARPGDLGLWGSLRRSSFTRTMFADIGVLSTVAALDLAVRGRTRARFVGAVGTLFVGSFALIPALAWEDWRALQRAGARERPQA